MTLVFLDGEFRDAAQARIPADDGAVLFGRGVYETFRAREGRVFLLDRHIARLREGAAALEIDVPAKVGGLEDIVNDLVGRSAIPDARVRVTLTAGSPSGGPSLLVQARPATDYPGDMYERGMTAVVSDVRRNETSPLSRIKSLNCLDSILSREGAHAADFETALLLNTAGNIAEASTANVFVARSGVIATPPIADGALPGVTRSFVIQDANETTLTLDDLLNADEAFLTGAVMGVMPLVRVGDQAIGKGRPGEATGRVMRRYEAAVRGGDVS